MKIHSCFSLSLALGVLLSVTACGKKDPLKHDAKETKASSSASSEEEKPKFREELVPESGALDSVHLPQFRIGPGQRDNSDADESATQPETSTTNVKYVPVDHKKNGQEDENSPRKAGGARKFWERTTVTPQDSLAHEMGSDPKVKILWNPEIIHHPLPSVRLPDIAISPDKSLLVIAETTGKPNGPFGTRFILINTHSWEIVKVFESKDRKVRRFVLVGNTPAIAAVCEKQLAIRQPASLVVFNLKAGAERSAIPILRDSLGKNQILCDRNGRIFLPDADAPKVEVYLARDLSLPAKTLEVTAPNPRLAVSPNGKSLAITGTKNVDLYKTSDLRPLSSVSLPSGYPVSQVLFVNNDQTILLAADPLTDKAPVLLRANQHFELKGRSAGFNEISSDGKLLILAGKVKGELITYDPVAITEINTINPAGLAPRFNGDPRAIFHLDSNGAIAVLDTRGNFYLVYCLPGEKRFQKDVLFTGLK